MLRFAGIIMGALVIALLALIAIRQHILRWRAERLLADIRALELGKSTWAHAQRIMKRWGAWGHYEGSCSEQRCSYQIKLTGFECSFCAHLPIAVVSLLAPRWAYVEGDMEVINGVVWRKNFFVEISVSGNIFKGDYYGYGLLASAGSVWRTAEFNRYYSASHPDYAVGRPGACEDCKSVYTKFTPFADTVVVRGLMDFNLDCLTRLFQCEDQIDIMPSVWRQVLAEDVALKAARNANPRSVYPSAASPEFLGRDRDNVVVAVVVSTRIDERGEEPRTIATFRLDRRLKRADFWDAKNLAEQYSPRVITSVGEIDKGRLISPGRKVILAFDTPYQVVPDHLLDLDDYAVLPYNDENLAAVRRGMSLDIFPPKTYHFP
jgi:hypothetical protein